MTIWILAAVLLGSTAGLGLRQGAIRAALSLAGIVTGALVATAGARVIRPWLSSAGLKSDMLLWLAAPVIVFAVVLIVFKIVGLVVHKRVELFYKYRAGDLKYALWQRLSHRLGLCLGFANGTAYLILISFVIYVFSYWTVQLAQLPPADDNPKALKVFNRMGKDLQSTGLASVGRAIDRMPSYFYDSADLAGILYHTPLLEARLYRYPGFLALAETPDFQALLNDRHFTELWQRQAPILDLINYPAIQSMLKNRDLLMTIWAALQPNLQDLGAFLTNGVSSKYESEQILGRWDFDANGSLNQIRKARPNITPREMAQSKNWMTTAFARTIFVAMADHHVVFKNYPHIKVSANAPPSTEMLTVRGQWINADGRYALTYSVDGRAQESAVTIEGDRLSITGQGLGLVFVRED